MSGWVEFIAALGVFFLSHTVPVRGAVRAVLVQHLGMRGYILGYSAVSIGLLVWIFSAAGRAPYVTVIPPLDILRWVPILVMPLVCALAVLGLSANNPLSFGGMGKAPFVPQAPGILAVTRHPLLLALLLWSLAHLLANGDLAHVLVFGLFAGFAGLGMVMIDRRMRREMGGGEWQKQAANTARLSLKAIAKVRPLLWQWLAIGGIFAGLLLLHPPVIGVSPLP